jgi:glycosyltransferase involved in cell wall biosynthesis
MERTINNLRPYVVHARELLTAGQYEEVFRGIGRVAARVIKEGYGRSERRFSHTPIAKLASGRESIDAKHQRLTPWGGVESKTSLIFPSPVASLLVSVIIPCFNYGSFVRDAVNSALAQTVKSLEVIVVDDGSTHHETKRVLDDLAHTPGVRVVRQTNQGLPSARNTGLLLARGEYICCLDADDLIEPTYLEMAIAVLEADRSVGFAYSWVQLFGDEERVWKTQDFHVDNARVDNHTAVSAVFRRDDWLAAGGYRPNMRLGYEDWDFWLRLACLGRRGRVLRTPLFNHRRHGRTMTHGAHDRRQLIMAMLRDGNPGFFYNSKLRDRIRRLASVRSASDPLAVLESRDVLHPHCGRPHLLAIVPWLANGGAEILLFDVFEELKQDWRITIVTTIEDEQQAWAKFKLITTDIIPLFGAFAEDQWPLVVDYLVRSRGASIVLSHGSACAYRILAQLKARYPSLKTIDILHNDLPGGHIRGAVAATNAIDRHVAVSDRIARSLGHYGVPSHRVVTIRNGVDTHGVFNPERYERASARSRFGLSETGLVLAWVGRLAKEKRPLEFVRILSSLRLHTPVEGVIVGDGPLSSELKAELDESGNRDYVKHISYMERHEIAAVYAAADVLVLTSSVEGLPLTSLEAMAMGCPVAATDVGDLRSIIEEGVSGLLVPAERPMDLATTLQPLLREPWRLATLRERCRHSLMRNKLDLYEMQAKYRELFASLVG